MDLERQAEQLKMQEQLVKDTTLAYEEMKKKVADYEQKTLDANNKVIQDIANQVATLKELFLGTWIAGVDEKGQPINKKAVVATTSGKQLVESVKQRYLELQQIQDRIKSGEVTTPAEMEALVLRLASISTFMQRIEMTGGEAARAGNQDIRKSLDIFIDFYTKYQDLYNLQQTQVLPLYNDLLNVTRN